MACSAADSTLDWGALTTITPRRVAAVDVDVVEADPGPAHDHQVGTRLQDLGRDLGLGADDEGGRALHRHLQLGRREPEADVDLVPRLPQAGQAALGDGFADEDSGHPAMVSHAALGGPEAD